MSSIQTHLSHPPSQRTSLRHAVVACACLVAGLTQVSQATAQTERGLMLPEAAYGNRWSHWAPRLGVVITDTQPSGAYAMPSSSAGLKIQSAHVLSDYHLGSGFKATLGLVRGATNLPWWQTPDSNMRGGAGLSVQRMDVLSNEGLPTYLGSDPSRTVPYIGAAYSGRLTESNGINAWRFQADLGLVSLNSSNAAHMGRVLSGEQGLDELIRELRLRPVVKFTINYKF